MKNESRILIKTYCDDACLTLNTSEKNIKKERERERERERENFKIYLSEREKIISI